jgi:FG-GAP repeat
MVGSTVPTRGSSIGHALALGGRWWPSWRSVLAVGLISAGFAALLAAALVGTPARSNARHSAPAAQASGSGERLRRGLAGLPPAAQGPVSAALGSARAGYAVGLSGGTLTASTPAQHLHSSFTSAGVSVHAGAASVGLGLVSVGYGSSSTLLGGARPVAHANRVLYTLAAGIRESFQNGPLGLEQSFTIARAPADPQSGPLTLSLALSGNVRASLQERGRGLALRRGGRTVLRYTGLSASDANGRPLRSWLEFRSGRLLLRVDTRSARFPVHVDPFVQIGGALSPLEELGETEFGSSVALSADGSTAVVGGRADNGGVGAAWVFTRSGNTWTQQAKLTGGEEEVGAGAFGQSVALSGDGNTALIGGGADDGRLGGAWIFTRSGEEWARQGPKLTGAEESADQGFGSSVSLSSDGNTALIGGPGSASTKGAVWFFTRGGEEWVPQGPAQSGPRTGDEFGISVALSGDGGTALVGAPGDGYGGKAFVYTRPESQWEEQAYLEGEEVFAHSAFGTSVALSADGATAVVGAPAPLSTRSESDLELPQAYVFERESPSWHPYHEAERFEEAPESDFGESVAVDGAGNAVVIGEPGPAGEGTLVSTLQGSIWSLGYLLPGPPGEHVTMSADETTALVAGANEAQPFALSPNVLTTGASSIENTTATLTATVDPGGASVTDCHFEYGPTSAYGSSAACSSLPGSGPSPEAVSAPIAGLEAATSYHYRIVATNSRGTSSGSDKSFKTLPNPPTVTTGTASEVVQTLAQLDATVNPNGDEVSECAFEYGTTSSYGSSAPCSPAPGAGESPVAVSASVVHLAPNTTYHFRVVATSMGGTGRGADETFVTVPEAPTVVTAAASSITTNSATLDATVNPNGDEVSECAFEYGTTSSYGSSAPCSPAPGAGESPVAVSASVVHLAPNTTYHFRVVATNAGGTSDGIDQTFQTSVDPPSVSTGSAAAVTQTTATLEGTVNPEGANVTSCKLEYGTTVSYGSSALCQPLPGSGESAVAVSAAVSGLTADTSYHFRVSATNAGGTSDATDQTFTTLPGAPTVQTGVGRQITETSAALHATVNPNGGAVTACEIEYATSPTLAGAASASCGAPGSGEQPVEVLASAGGLAGTQTYYFRVSATNAGGNRMGAINSFTVWGTSFGECIKVAAGTGAFRKSTCSAAGGKKDYEWHPGVAKAGFELSAATGRIEFQPVDLEHTLKCATATGGGEYTGTKTVGSIKLTFTGCRHLSEQCSSAGAAAGEIVASTLEGALRLAGFSGLGPVDLELFPVGRAGPVAQFTCANFPARPTEVIGSVLVPIAVNRMVLAQNLRYKASRGLQEPEAVAGGRPEILEQSFFGSGLETVGLIASLTQTNEQPVEVSPSIG